jgi:Flp pilus assembly protein TadG
MRHRAEKRQGTIIAVVAVLLVAILGNLAIALDGGLLLDDKRQVQAAADAAALAAATDLFNNYGTNNGLDPSGTASASALATAAANGFSNDGTNTVVTVNLPPNNYLGGPNKGTALPNGYVEVSVQLNQKRLFSSLFGSSTLPVQARAVAKGIRGNIGILILDHTLQAACEIDGTVNILNGGQIWVNSDATSPNDSPLTGGCYVASTSTLSCGGINVVGDLNNLGHITYTNGGSVQEGVQPKPDPLASIPEPTTSGLTNRGNVTVSTTSTLQPGIYGNVTINAGTGTVTLAPGIYYFANGGSLRLSSGTLTGTGVLIFDQTGGDSILNVAQGTVNITPPTGTSGGTWPTGTTSATYMGISFWIPRSQTKEVHIESTCNLTMPGTWYAQGGEFDFRPNGSTVVFNMGNYICDQAEWGQGFDNSKNKSNGTINMNPGSAAPTVRPTLVE